MASGCDWFYDKALGKMGPNFGYGGSGITRGGYDNVFGRRSNGRRLGSGGTSSNAAMEDSLVETLNKASKYIKQVRRPITRATAPVAGLVAGVGIASGGYLWHANRENKRKYGAR